ncbi:OmpA family protein [Rosenbergiella nectarea]|uniref:OmpA family protein n=1 Tax=Rosenbergiella nectarea TaxID=988801 RepID=UPI001BD97670|nr:OmpA family protein [Rosenbergiella nectarea]MBT0730442.1 OmpA family protein [Rosenbergiella nectarea subsp. apis]
MDKRTDKKFVDPVVDQKIIKQKKGKGIWWLLLAIIIIILAIWFSTQRNNNDAAPAPSSSSSAMSQPAQQPAATDDSTAAAPAADSDASLTALQQYYGGEGNDDSQWIDLDQVSFATGNATPSITDEQSLNQVASLISQHPDHSIVVRGFTDSTGNEAINQPLSGQRANAIKDWLTQHGVDGSKITIDGQGADHAVANNDTAQGRDQNRRVAIQVKAAQ